MIWQPPSFDAIVNQLCGAIEYRLLLGELESARVLAIEVVVLLGSAGRWDERNRAEEFSLALSALRGRELAQV